jgi:hypothetical protein
MVLKGGRFGEQQEEEARGVGVVFGVIFLEKKNRKS